MIYIDIIFQYILNYIDMLCGTTFALGYVIWRIKRASKKKGK